MFVITNKEEPMAPLVDPREYTDATVFLGDPGASEEEKEEALQQLLRIGPIIPDDEAS
jgi:hypothetical protein